MEFEMMVEVEVAAIDRLVVERFRLGATLLLDNASSDSVCVFWTCRTQSAGVTKNIEQRSHRNAAMFSPVFTPPPVVEAVLMACWLSV